MKYYQIDRMLPFGVVKVNPSTGKNRANLSQNRCGGDGYSHRCSQHLKQFP